MSLFGDINEVKIMGNLTQDIELRYTAGGTAVANFSVATNRRYRQNEEWKDETEFHNVVVWTGLAEQLAQRAKKGTRLMITGRIQTRSWEGQDGQKKYRTEIVADDAFLIDRYEKGKSDDLPAPQATKGGGSNSGGDFPPMDEPSHSKSNSASGKAAAKKNDDLIDPDDLPF